VSTGIHEAVELRDGDKNAYGGKGFVVFQPHADRRRLRHSLTGVLKAFSDVNDIIERELIKSGLKVTQQTEIDNFLIKPDGTANKGRLGANAIVAVSMAVAVAGAAENGIPLYQHIAELAGVKPQFVLPCPVFNVVNGGQTCWK
jgi:enolase